MNLNETTLAIVVVAALLFGRMFDGCVTTAADCRSMCGGNTPVRFIERGGVDHPAQCECFHADGGAP